MFLLGENLSLNATSRMNATKGTWSSIADAVPAA
jgi:hypothetical protein